jgi:Flp pilus assembly protein TadD
MKALIRKSIRSSALWVAVSLALPACASLEGARLYASGTRALEAGRPEQAAADLEAASRLLPASSAIQNHLGLAYVQIGRDREAAAAFQRAVELDCGNDAAESNLRAAEAGRLRPPGDDHE